MNETSAAPRRSRQTGLTLFFVAAIIAGLVMLVHVSSGPDAAPPDAGAPVAADLAGFQPPNESTIPDGPEGDSIRRGKELFLRTGELATQYVGSGLTCGNCHLDAGRTANASPMWAAWGMYPAYRTKNDAISTMEDRILGCFIYSMNAQASPAGAPPPPGDDIYRDMSMYFAWLAKGVPVGQEMPGRGFLKLDVPADGFDPGRGAAVYEEHCSVCHGENGEGVGNPDGTYTYPPLWGDASFNWGAGMSKTANAAGFIKANMPFGMGYTLTDQQAWDVAAYVTSRERPRDPRQTGSIEEARARHHKNGDYYGQMVDGDLLGDGVP
ncbi:c-type cytochrome [Erythrobacter aurantius]|uniref:c-type cytochrome n=1 Tax=Erythrobacter aurantius TaxID=2909249 RepID=UPI00207998F2|nr:c-type cytochrome [Erythrobacter aurantius]